MGMLANPYYPAGQGSRPKTVDWGDVKQTNRRAMNPAAAFNALHGDSLGTVDLSEVPTSQLQLWQSQPNLSPLPTMGGAVNTGPVALWPHAREALDRELSKRMWLDALRNIAGPLVGGLVGRGIGGALDQRFGTDYLGNSLGRLFSGIGGQPNPYDQNTLLANVGRTMGQVGNAAWQPMVDQSGMSSWIYNLLWGNKPSGGGIA